MCPRLANSSKKITKTLNSHSKKPFNMISWHYWKWWRCPYWATVVLRIASSTANCAFSWFSAWTAASLPGHWTAWLSAPPQQSASSTTAVSQATAHSLVFLLTSRDVCIVHCASHCQQVVLSFCWQAEMCASYCQQVSLWWSKTEPVTCWVDIADSDLWVVTCRPCQPTSAHNRDYRHGRCQ